MTRANDAVYNFVPIEPVSKTADRKRLRTSSTRRDVDRPHSWNLNCVVEAVRVSPDDANAVPTPARGPVSSDQTGDLILSHVAYAH